MEMSIPIKLVLLMHIFIFQYASICSFSSYSTTNSTNADMLALLAIKSKIQLPPNSPILSSWNSNTSLCNWHGVSCSLRHKQRVSGLNISYMNIHGTISPHIGNLSFLRVLNLSSNSLRGPIPETVGQLHRLRVLNLRDNQLEGSIPSTINGQSLEVVHLQYNHLVGSIPSSLLNISTLRVMVLSFNRISASIPMDMCRTLPKLEMLLLSVNPLGGHIPTSFCLCRNLKHIELSENGLTGSIPTDLGCLSQLKSLNLATNQLTGTIPASLGNLSKLESLDLSENNLYGKLFAGFSFPKLTELYLRGNRFSGRIPDSISNASMLKTIEFSNNSFSGPVPMTLGSLWYLEYLNVQINKLTNHPSQKKLHFLTSLTQCRKLQVLNIGSNPLNAALPESIGNLSTSLEIFSMYSSQIQGVLPSQIGNLSSLLGLDGSSNDLVGALPSSMGNLKKLQSLFLDGNRLQGNLPNEVCQLTSLSTFIVAENNLSGLIPSCFGNNLTKINRIYFSSNAFTSIPNTMWSLTNAWFMNFSHNSLTGYLSPEIGKLVILQTLDLSNNRFSGTIPATLSNLKMLQQLNMSHNAFQGNIPISIVDLASLESLDLSSNNLSGIIPESLEKLRYLNFLNLSFNMLSGPVPVNGAFPNFSIRSFMGNRDLCGNSSKLKLLPCPDTAPTRSRKATFWLKYVLPPIASVILGVLLLTLYMKCWRKSKNLSLSSTGLSLKLGHKHISYYDLLSATNNLGEANLLGSGSFGSVYKGTMPDGEIVAVKVFDLEVEGAVTSFDRECQVLRNVRHRNLVKIITCCSNLDFRALILQYMPNGSLEKLLYNQGPNSLDILQRMNIMIDVAMGIEYLHHGYSEPIVHCDLKPSNVLLDEDMVAHVADFGIAKILAKYKSMTQTGTLGTLGYIAPGNFIYFFSLDYI